MDELHLHYLALHLVDFVLICSLSELQGEQRQPPCAGSG